MQYLIGTVSCEYHRMNIYALQKAALRILEGLSCNKSWRYAFVKNKILAVESIILSGVTVRVFGLSLQYNLLLNLNSGEGRMLKKDTWCRLKGSFSTSSWISCCGKTFVIFFSIYWLVIVYSIIVYNNSNNGGWSRITINRHEITCCADSSIKRTISDFIIPLQILSTINILEYALLVNSNVDAVRWYCNKNYDLVSTEQDSLQTGIRLFVVI